MFLLVLLGVYAATRIVGVVANGSFLAFVDWFQRQTKVSNAVAGELFQSLGTSAPEIAINAYATYIAMSNPALGVAAIIGSALFQITVVIAVPVLLHDGTSSLDRKAVLRSTSVYFFAVVLLIISAWDGVFLAWELFILVLSYAGYVALLLSTDRVSVGSADDVDEETSTSLGVLDEPMHQFSHWVDRRIPRPSTSFWGFPLSIAVIAVFVAATVELAETGGEVLGLSSSFMALTVLAAGSSVPELSSNVAKAREDKLDQVVGNALGSNSFDIFVSFGAVSLWAAWSRGGLAMPGTATVFLPAVLLLVCLGLVVGTLWACDWEVRRWTPYLLLGFYAAFVAFNLVYG